MEKKLRVLAARAYQAGALIFKSLLGSARTAVVRAVQSVRSAVTALRGAMERARMVTA